MSSYKSYTPRRTADPATQSTDRLRDKAEKLQELFPSWSNDDLQSVLVETAGDVELAVARISEGHAEQWGSVTRKREKKIQPSSTSSPSARTERERPTGDSIRGGRGGRGGRGRGGRGGSRAAATAAHQREAGGTSAGANGTTNHVGPANGGGSVDAAPLAPTNGSNAESATNGTGTGDSRDTKKATMSHPNEAVGEVSSSKDAPGPSTSVPGVETMADLDTGTAPTRTPVQNGTLEHMKPKVQAKSSKIPPGSKLSWAQIARVQEKPKPSPAPVTSQLTSPPPLSSLSESQPATVAEDTPHVSDQHQQGWEEPTTVQPPTWDDEPSNVQTQPPEPHAPGHDGWITTTEALPSHPPVQEIWDSSASYSVPKDPSQEPHWRQEEPASLPSPQVTTPSITSIAPSTSTPSVATSTAPTSKPSTPLVANASARPVNSHRTSARYPKSDQAVVIPAFAGNIGVGGEKLGMQFGSLSISGEDNFDGPFKPEGDQASSASGPEQVQQAQPPQAQASIQPQQHDAIQTPIVPSSHSQAFFQQQQQQQPTSSAPTQPQQTHSPSQPPQHPPQQAAPSGPPFGPLQQPQSLSQSQLPHNQQPQQPSYVQQHGIHAHFDGPPVPQQQQQQQHHLPGPQTSSYFRQPESPYYHNPTPPQSAAADHQGAYATTFSPLGVGAGAHAHAQGLGVGQGQGAHLGGFGAGGPADYMYGDGQRGFYDYSQPNSFSGRLVHEEPTKGLPISQQAQPASSLGSTAGQPQPSGAQGASAQPPGGQQGQQQGYPAPMPYYYPPYYPQNSYPTYPNPSYGQAYMHKYPPVYPHQAPVGPGSAPPPSGKGPGGGAAPYNASASQSHLYHGQGGFEDPSSGYQHHQGSGNLGNNEYQKQQPHHQQQQPLYGGQGGQGLQSFLGIQQAAGGGGQGVSGPGGQQRTGTSPENAYKPYGAPGAGEKGGVGIGAQPGQQGRATGVQSQQQAAGGGSFYPAAGRFSGGAGGPQQQGQQQGQGYPQGGDQGQFYPYQPRHQGGYWQ